MMPKQKQGIRIKSKLKAGVTKDITTIYSECFNQCYPEVINNSNTTYDECLAQCTGDRDNQIS